MHFGKANRPNNEKDGKKIPISTDDKIVYLENVRELKN